MEVPPRTEQSERSDPGSLVGVRVEGGWSFSTVWRRFDLDALRLGAALLAAASLGGALYRLPTLAGVGHRYLKQPDLSVEAADLDPVRFFVQTSVVLAAANSIPRGATYTIALGPGVPPSAAVVLRMSLLPSDTPRLSVTLSG